MSKLAENIPIWVYLLRFALYHGPISPHLVRQSFLDLILHHLSRKASGIDEVIDPVEEVVDIAVAMSQAVPFLDRLISGEALTEARLKQIEKGVPFPKFVVLVELNSLPGRSMPIDINVDIFIPLLRLAFEEGHNKTNLVHFLVERFLVIVELRFEIQNEALEVISISIEGSDV